VDAVDAVQKMRVTNIITTEDYAQKTTRNLREFRVVHTDSQLRQKYSIKSLPLMIKTGKIYDSTTDNDGEIERS
jgi:hypothetical protein